MPRKHRTVGVSLNCRFREGLLDAEIFRPELGS